MQADHNIIALKCTYTCTVNKFKVLEIQNILRYYAPSIEGLQMAEAWFQEGGAPDEEEGATVQVSIYGTMLSIVWLCCFTTSRRILLTTPIRNSLWASESICIISIVNYTICIRLQVQMRLRARMLCTLFHNNTLLPPPPSDSFSIQF